MKKSLQTNKQTKIITENAKTIYPLYTLYQGYKYMISIPHMCSVIKKVDFSHKIYVLTLYSTQAPLDAFEISDFDDY